MLKILTFVITIPLSLFVLLFAVSNTHKVGVSLIFTEADYDMPLYMIALGLMAIGFLCGCLLVWLNLYGYRIRYWRASRKITKMEEEIERQQDTIAEKDEALKKMPAPYIAPRAGDENLDNRIAYYDD